MPHTKSAKKSLRQDAKRNLRNRDMKKGLKVELKKLSKSLATGSPEEIKKEMSACFKKLDKAASKRVIHPNKASRKKSQVARMVNKKLATPAAGTSA